jgi:transcriptional regulator with XRE-family HTH domain
MHSDGLLKKLGARIRELRLGRGETQETLAERSGLHRNFVGGIERGERNVTVRSLHRISKALRVHIRELFNDLE